MLLEFLKGHLPEVLLFISGLGAWSYERNKRRLDLKQTETNSNKSIMDLYQEALDDLKNRYDEKFTELRAEVEELKHLLDAERQKNINLKRDFENYKKKHP